MEDTLSNRLRDRPDIEELQERKILIFAETVEVLPTFRKSEYNRKPDANATFKNLTPQMKNEIREELNTFKKTEMAVHEESNAIEVSFIVLMVVNSFSWKLIGQRNTCFH